MTLISYATSLLMSDVTCPVDACARSTHRPMGTVGPCCRFFFSNNHVTIWVMGEAIPYARVEKGPQSDGPWNAEPSSFKSGSTSFPLLI